MNGLLQSAALLCTAAAVAASGVTLLRTKHLPAALPVLLDLLLAAGLLRLALPLSGRRLATAAALVLVRRLLSTGLQFRSRRA